jgi:thymidylate kinase
MNPKKLPIVITFEGMPCAGKSTQIDSLTNTLSHDGYLVKKVDRIYDSVSRKVHDLRNTLLYPNHDLKVVEELREAYFEMYRRSHQSSKNIDCDVLIYDRFFFSAMAYVKTWGYTFSKEQIDFIQSIKQNHIILLDVNPSTSVERSKLTMKKSRLAQNLDFAKALRSNYLNLAIDYSFNVINANQEESIVEKNIYDLLVKSTHA